MVWDGVRVLQDLLIGRVRAAHYDCALNLTVLGWRPMLVDSKRFGSRVWVERGRRS